MANLLGGEYCIDSLRQDVKDLQVVLGDVESRVGQVKYRSWKFPDKTSCDVDVEALLKRCKFNKDDTEDCQMSHVMLYDVVIDRLVYLLQSFICFNEILLNVEPGGAGSPSRVKSASIRSMSVGLTVKKCWSRITQIAALLQKLAKEVSQKAKETSASSVAVSPASTKKIIPRELHDSPKSCESEEDGKKNKDISCDVRTVSCQTSETAYASCETCRRTQSCMNDVGRSIVDVCKSQGLPTALEDYQARYSDEVLMSCADLIRWSKHQAKDLSRISRHMTSLVNLVTPLKTQIQDMKKAGEAVRNELGQCQSVFERKEAELMEDFRRKEFKLKETEKDLKRKISTLESIRTGLQEETDKCRWKISDLKDELLQKHRDVLNLETAISQHKEEAVEGQQYKKDALRFKSELSKVNSELDEVNEKLSRSKQQYDMEVMRNENLSQHEQMLQEKQKTMLKRMEAVNDECEKLQEHIILLEKERTDALAEVENLQKTNDKSDSANRLNQELTSVQEKEMEFLKQTIESLRSENLQLNSAVDEYVERERVLVAYPDLNKSNSPSPLVQGSGDVLTDMKKQIEANQIRMEVLQKENDALIKTLHKIDTSHEHDSFAPQDHSSPAASARKVREICDPIQLWNTSDTSFNQETEREDAENSPEAMWYQNRMKSRSPSEKSFFKSVSSRSKPPSGRYRSAGTAPNKAHKTMDVPEINGIRMGHTTSAYSSNSMEAYKKLKQRQQDTGSRQGTQNVRSSFTVGTGKRPQSGRPISAKSALLKPWT